MARHLYSCPLRWSDMDAYGHVNNAVFLRYLEEARIDLIHQLRLKAAEGSFADGSVVARHEIDYLRPLVHRAEPVTVETWVTKVGAASMTVSYEVKDAEQVYVRASTVVVPFDLASGRPRRVTADEKELLKTFADEPAGAAGSSEEAVAA
ncbi:thioesterase family protein [Streptomyces sp. NPDC046261]|uniref:acyl-CoA thioesterase n=1 Tax=Streptomyces sp. NPDC046261 TaxID=3157200 RepID=UPI0034107DF9